MPVEETEFLRSCDLRVFYPQWGGLAADYEMIDWKTRLSRLQFLLMTKGHFTVYHLCDGNAVVHTAYVIPACKKFPFMGSKDYEIGPCKTDEKYRRMGAYRFVLTQILQKEAGLGRTAFMIVSEDNEKSIRGIESVGFVRTGTVKPSKWLKIYRLGS